MRTLDLPTEEDRIENDNFSDDDDTAEEYTPLESERQCQCQDTLRLIDQQGRCRACGGKVR